MSRILTYSGHLVDPFALKPEEINVRAIAHALGHLNRYTGHTRVPYSVAEHSVLLSWVVPPHLALPAILHDMHEAFCNDLPRPMKSRVPEFLRYEEAVQRQIFAHFGCDFRLLRELETYDYRICINEMKELMWWRDGKIEDLFPKNITALPGVQLQLWVPSLASLKFTNRFQELVA